MKTILVLMCILSFALLLFCSQPEAEPVANAETVVLKAGDPAPKFNLKRTTDKERVSLDNLLKDGPLLLAFYPAAFTSG